MPPPTTVNRKELPLAVASCQYLPNSLVVVATLYSPLPESPLWLQSLDWSVMAWEGEAKVLSRILSCGIDSLEAWLRPFRFGSLTPLFPWERLPVLLF